MVTRAERRSSPDNSAAKKKGSYLQAQFYRIKARRRRPVAVTWGALDSSLDAERRGIIPNMSSLTWRRARVGKGGAGNDVSSSYLITVEMLTTRWQRDRVKAARALPVDRPPSVA